MMPLILLAAFLVGNLLLTALFLWLGAIWVKASKARYWRAVIATLIIGVVGVLYILAAMWLQSHLGPQAPARLLVPVASVIVPLVVSWLVIAALLRTTFLRAILAWLVTLIPAAAAIACVYLVIQPYVLQAFVVPSNSMAPTVIGWHKTSVCPKCQGLLIVPAEPPGLAGTKQAFAQNARVC